MLLKIDGTSNRLMILTLAVTGFISSIAQGQAPEVPALKDIQMPPITYKLPTNNTPGIYHVSSDSTNQTLSTDADNPGSLTFTLNNAEPGSTVILRGGEYRLAHNLTRPLTIQAYPGERPMFIGSDVVDSWTQCVDAHGRAAWYTPWQHKFTHDSNLVFNKEFPEAVHLDMVYRDGVTVEQTLDNPMTPENEGYEDGSIKRDFKPGRFWIGQISGEQRVYLADDPTGRRIELSARRNNFNFGRGSAGSVVRGLAFVHGAVNGMTVNETQITLEQNLFAWNGNYGLGLHADNVIIRNNYFIANGQNGISGGVVGEGKGALIEGNYVAWNNRERFRTDWNAAGIKLIFLKNLRIFNNIIERNHSFGIWLDSHANSAQIVGNISRHNFGAGIFFESSHDAIIAFNTLNHNGWGGIWVTDASHAQLWNNTIVGGVSPIKIKDGDRFNDKKASVQGNYSELQLICGSWEITYGTVIKNNILSSGQANLLSAEQVFGPIQNPSPDPDGAYASLPEGQMSADGKVVNPMPLRHTGSASMFYDASFRSSDWTKVPNAISHNLFHNPSEARNKTAIGWRLSTDGKVQQWSPSQLAENSDQNHVFVQLQADAPLFINPEQLDFRLVPQSQAISGGTRIADDVRKAAAAAGIDRSLYETATPHIGALSTVLP